MRRSIEILANTGSDMSKTGTKAKSDSYYGYTDGIHSVSIKYSQFVGTVKLQASLSLDPADADWGDIKLITKNIKAPNSDPVILLDIFFLSLEIEDNFNLAELFYNIHIFGNYTLISLISLHILAVIIHKIIFKENLLKKIL